MSAIVKLTGQLAARFGVEGSEAELYQTLKATAFKGNVTDAQFTTLMVVANQYKLNPFTKELFAFPDKQNGIVPVVGVDGWSRILNDHPQFDGLEFAEAEETVTPAGGKPCPTWIECIIYRKDRRHPIRIREHLDEVYREPIKTKDGRIVDTPWQSHTKRFLRHKAMIQAARIAFGFAGIYDQDEAERIVSNQEASAFDKPAEREVKAEVVEMEAYPADRFAANFPKWEAAIQQGVKTADDVINAVSSRAKLTDEQIAAIREVAPVVADDDAPF